MRLRTLTSALVALALGLLSGWIAVEQHGRALATLDARLAAKASRRAVAVAADVDRARAVALLGSREPSLAGLQELFPGSIEEATVLPESSRQADITRRTLRLPSGTVLVARPTRSPRTGEPVLPFAIQLRGRRSPRRAVLRFELRLRALAPELRDGEFDLRLEDTLTGRTVLGDPAGREPRSVSAEVPARFGDRNRWRVTAAARSAPSATAGIGPAPGLVLAAGFAIGLTARSRARRRRLAAGREQRQQERFRALVQHASDMLLIVGPGGEVRSATGACEGVLGEAADAIEGRPLAARVHAEDAGGVLPLLGEALAGRATLSAVWRMRHADGRWIHVEIIVADLTGHQGVDGLVLTCRDVSARAALERQLRHRAYHDPLTQLPNRGLLLDRIEHGLAREDHTVALLFVDLDDFKVVNDGLGHAAGDGVLIAVASRLRGCLRSADTAARLGGDEFAVLLDGIVSDGEAEAVAHRILDTLRRPFLVHGEPVRVGVSVGLAITRTRTIGVDELLRRADFAMYAAKHSGKGRVERFDPAVEAELVEHFEPTAPVNDEAERVTWFARAEEQRAEIEAVLAAPEERIAQVFQPIVDLRTGFVAAYEALSRFQGSRRPPNAWFAQAHRCGLGIELELVAARAQLAIADRPAGTRVSINLSPSALLSAEAENGLAGDLSHLTIEVTEDELVSEGTALEERLADLRGRGARLAVDDVGAGYAGLKQVVRVRPDLLKLDRSLVDGVSGDPAKVAMIDALVRYARFIGAEVCAEGVETLEDLRTLADLDVTYGQGYGLARPGPAWSTVAPAAAAVCAAAQSAAIRHDDEGARDAVGSSELQLERVCHQITDISCTDELHLLLEPMRELLGVEDVALSVLDPAGTGLLTVMADTDENALNESHPLADYPATGAAMASGASLQVLASDAAADPAERELLRELGFGALLLVPLIASGRAVGVLEAYGREERPWSRGQVHRARIVSYQLAFVLASTSALEPDTVTSLA